MAEEHKKFSQEIKEFVEEYAKNAEQMEKEFPWTFLKDSKKG